jgi:hypothetical protein
MLGRMDVLADPELIRNPSSRQAVDEIEQASIAEGLNGLVATDPGRI